MKKYLIFIFGLLVFNSFSQSGLKNVVWVLSKIEDTKEKTNINLNHTHSILKFDDSTYTGYGCNGFSGKYKIVGNKINFIGGMQITDNACGNPDDYKAQDYVLDNFIQLEYKQIGETLILKKGSEVIFTYNKQKPE